MKQRTNLVSRRDLVPQYEAQRILEPHLDTLSTGLHLSWDWAQGFLDHDPISRRVLHAATVAGMVYDRFVYSLPTMFLEVRNVEIRQSGRLVQVIFDHALRLRFKKFNGNLCSSNARTNQQYRIYHQLELDGVLNPLTDVTFGYVTSLAETAIDGVYITCPIGWVRNKWFIVVDPPAHATIPIDFPDPGAPPPAEIRAKGSKAKRAE